MDYLQQCIDLRRPEGDPELFAIALALCHIRALIQHSWSDMRRPDLELALHLEHLEFFLARAVEIPWKDARLVQEWRKVQQVLPRVREGWEKGQSLSQSACTPVLGGQWVYAGMARTLPQGSGGREHMEGSF